MHILFDLLCDIDHAEREDQIVHIILLGILFALDKMARKIDMRTKLSRKPERLDQAFQHGIAPVKDGFRQFYSTCRDS